MRGAKVNQAKPKAAKPAKLHFLECPSCGGELAVKYTRPKKSVVNRRRECPKCGGRFTTTEKFVNRKNAESSTGKAAIALSVTEFLQSLGMTPADLPNPVTFTTGGHADEPDPRPG